MIGVAVEIGDTAVFYFRNKAAGIRTIMRACPAHNFCIHLSPHIELFGDILPSGKQKSGEQNVFVRRSTILIQLSGCRTL